MNGATQLQGGSNDNGGNKSGCREESDWAEPKSLTGLCPPSLHSPWAKRYRLENILNETNLSREFVELEIKALLDTGSSSIKYHFKVGSSFSEAFNAGEKNRTGKRKAILWWVACQGSSVQAAWLVPAIIQNLLEKYINLKMLYFGMWRLS